MDYYYRSIFIVLFNIWLIIVEGKSSDEQVLLRTRSDESLYTKFENSDENGIIYQYGQKNGTNGVKKNLFGLDKQFKNNINKGQNGLKKVNNGIFTDENGMKNGSQKAKFGIKIDQNRIKKGHLTVKKDKSIIKKDHEGLSKNILTQYYGLMNLKQVLLEDAYHGYFDISKMHEYIESFSKFILELPKNIVDKLGSKKLIGLINDPAELPRFEPQLNQINQILDTLSKLLEQIAKFGIDQEKVPKLVAELLHLQRKRPHAKWLYERKAVIKWAGRNLPNYGTKSVPKLLVAMEAALIFMDHSMGLVEETELVNLADFMGTKDKLKSMISELSMIKNQIIQKLKIIENEVEIPKMLRQTSIEHIYVEKLIENMAEIQRVAEFEDTKITNEQIIVESLTNCLTSALLEIDSMVEELAQIEYNEYEQIEAMSTLMESADILDQFRQQIIL